MAITFIGSTSGTSSANNFFLEAPSGVQVGDLVVVAVYSSNQHAFPAGWTVADTTLTPLDPKTRQTVYWKVMTAADISAFPLNISTFETVGWVAAAYRGAVAVSAIAPWSGSATTEAFTPVVSVAANGSVVVGVIGGTRPTLPPLPTGYVSRVTALRTTFAYRAIRLGDQPANPPQYDGGSAAVESGDWVGHSIILQPTNTAPNAPILNSPADGSTIDLGITQRFAWTFSDPDPGDSQSQYDLRYRIVGAPSWTTVGGSVPNAYRDIASGTFTAGDYEWQTRTYDAAGLVGPYSASSFFTAAVPTGVPTITAPTSGGTVDTDPHTVTWSTAGGQDAYQVRRVADLAGTADTATVYYDTGEVVDSAARSASVPFETNNRYEHIQVRVKLDGLWSSWASIRVLVSYTPPTVPTVALSEGDDTGAILVTITNPAPGTGDPATSYNDIYVTDPGKSEERRATAVATNGSWIYWLPAGGVDYSTRIRVVAVGDNGTTSSSVVPAAVVGGSDWDDSYVAAEAVDGGSL